MIPFYLHVQFLHLLSVAIWSFSTTVAFRNFIIPAFRAWQRDPHNPERIAKRNEFMERFDKGVILEHIAFPVLVITGLMLVWLAVCIFVLAAWWKVYAKAGEPGWACLIPIYQIIVLDRIAGKPTWWFFIYLFLGPIWWIMISLALAEKFGKGTGFGVGIMLLFPIFIPILAFGDAQYQG